MGLDNKIILAFKIEDPYLFRLANKYGFKIAEPDTIYDDIPYYHIEGGYWRKFWGFRNQVVKKFDWSDEDETIINLNAPQILSVISILRKYLSKHYWYNHENNHIWTYTEYKPTIIKSIKHLKKLYKLLKKLETIKGYEEHYTCYFSDSY